MTTKDHHYCIQLNWTGNNDTNVAKFRNHNRSYTLSANGKPTISGSSDAVFRGDSTRWNPEDLLVASLSACHHLWYMGLCAAAGIIVTAYEDEGKGVMVEDKFDGAGQFKEVILRPCVTLALDSNKEIAESLHHTAHERCFIARSVNFPVTVIPVTRFPF